MGFGMLQRPKVTYFNPLFGEGFFVTKSAADAVQRTNKRNAQVWEKRANWLAGHLIEVLKMEDAYGFFFQVRLHQDGESVVFSLPFDAPQTRMFLNCLLSAPAKALGSVFTVRVSRRRRKKDQKELTYLNLHLADETSFAKETALRFRHQAQELPEPDSVMVDGKQRSDFTNMTNFLWNEVEEKVIPHLPRIEVFAQGTAKTESVAHEATDGLEEIQDDSPFSSFPVNDDIPF